MKKVPSLKFLWIATVWDEAQMARSQMPPAALDLKRRFGTLGEEWRCLSDCGVPQ